jgi:hypothetical protein
MPYSCAAASKGLVALLLRTTNAAMALSPFGIDTYLRVRTATLKRSIGRRPIPVSPFEWKGRYRIEGPAFVHTDRDTGRVMTVLGHRYAKVRNGRGKNGHPV